MPLFVALQHYHLVFISRGPNAHKIYNAVVREHVDRCSAHVHVYPSPCHADIHILTVCIHNKVNVIIYIFSSGDDGNNF